ncbi:MAG: DNA/RNA nuclease SfsA [bacterium]|nr:DNA/RNA nuclease SfsA [bacterium]
MLLPEKQEQGILLRRYKRFLADIRLNDGQEITVHCPNSGSMLGCSNPGSQVIISWSDNPARKYPWSLEMVRSNGFWIGVHTGRTNHLVQEGLEQGAIDAFGQVNGITREVRVASGSRLDFLLETVSGPVYLEVKHCSLAQNGVGLFPDAVTTRGAKHMRELEALAMAGMQAAVLFCVQRADAETCSVAAHIDPAYALAVHKAAACGVRFLAWQTEVQPQFLCMTNQIPFCLPTRVDS